MVLPDQTRDEGDVSLRALRLEDSPLLYEWITDRELLLLNAPYRPVTEIEHKRWIDSMLGGRPDVALFVIEMKSSRLPIGTCQLLHINLHSRNAELQIRIGTQSLHGKGFGTQAVRRLVEYGFRDLNLHRIYLHVFATNERAIRSYEKCGFVREGCLRQAVFIDGSYIDVNVMSRLANE